MDYTMTPTISLALGALVGALVMVVPALYLHKRRFDQALDRLTLPEDENECHGRSEHIHCRKKNIRRRDKLFSNSFEDDSCDEDENDNFSGEEEESENAGIRSYRMSSSMPSERVLNKWIDDKDNKDGDQYAPNPVPTFSVGSNGRLVAPRLRGSGEAASVGDYGEDGAKLAIAGKAPSSHDHENDKEFKGNREIRGDVVQFGGKKAAPSLYTTGSTPLLFNNASSLAPTLADSMNVEEEEVLKMIRECLDLREKYVFRETVAPWMTGSCQEPGIKLDPFHFVPVKASAHHCKMEDGVMHVYANVEVQQCSSLICITYWK